MSEMIQAYPLQWPSAWPRTDTPQRSRFGVSFAVARDDLLSELELLGATDIVISANIELRRDGLPYANRPEPDDRGVAIYFVWHGRTQCIPVDRWDRVRDNVRAAGLIEAAGYVVVERGEWEAVRAALATANAFLLARASRSERGG